MCWHDQDDSHTYGKNQSTSDIEILYAAFSIHILSDLFKWAPKLTFEGDSNLIALLVHIVLAQDVEISWNYNNSVCKPTIIFAYACWCYIFVVFLSVWVVIWYFSQPIFMFFPLLGIIICTPC